MRPVARLCAGADNTFSRTEGVSSSEHPVSESQAQDFGGGAREARVHIGAGEAIILSSAMITGDTLHYSARHAMQMLRTAR